MQFFLGVLLFFLRVSLGGRGWGNWRGRSLAGMETPEQEAQPQDEQSGEGET